MITPASFPLAGAVAVVGSRHGSPYGVAQFVGAVVRAGGTVRTGCAAGVDTAALVALVQAGQTFCTVRADQSSNTAQPGHMQIMATGRAPRELGTRTCVVVRHAGAVAIFPPTGGWRCAGPGSRLALSEALLRNLPVFVAGPTPNGPAWLPAVVGGVTGWYMPAPQPALF